MRALLELLRPAAPRLSEDAMERLRLRWNREELDAEADLRRVGGPHPFAVTGLTIRRPRGEVTG